MFLLSFSTAQHQIYIYIKSQQEYLLFIIIYILYTFPSLYKFEYTKMDQKSSSQAPTHDVQILVSNQKGSPEDLYFDSIVGTLQAIVLEPNFINLQDTFIKSHCMVFEPMEENKIQYMQVFQQYQTIVEKYILENLTQRLPGFTMPIFSDLLASRVHQIDEGLLEMLNSFTDFQVFKQLMLQHKKYYCDQHKFGGLTIKGVVCKFSTNM